MSSTKYDRRKWQATNCYLELNSYPESFIKSKQTKSIIGNQLQKRGRELLIKPQGEKSVIQLIQHSSLSPTPIKSLDIVERK